MLQNFSIKAFLFFTAVKAVSIQLQGDKLVVVTEEEEERCKNITENNINRNESKFDTSSSTDIDTQSLSSDSNSPSNLGLGTAHMVLDGINSSDGLPIPPTGISRVLLA